MTAAAEEALERKIFALEVTPLATLPITPSAGVPIITYILIVISSLISLAIGGRYLRNYLKRSKAVQPPAERVEILKRIKEKIKSKR